MEVPLNQLPTEWSLLTDERATEWALYAVWEPIEFLLLSVGVEPTSVDLGILMQERHRYPFNDLLTRHANIFDRDSKRFEIIRERRPEEYLVWMKKYELTAPDVLQDAVAKARHLHRGSGGSKRNESNTVPTRERESLLKLVIGMAVAGYSYDPKAVRGAATSDIVDDLAKLGIPLDADTVRKYLRQGRELLPPETE